ncbi:hypothetical protein EMIT0P176_130095 [Pseudomonas sp. IT-P176]
MPGGNRLRIFVKPQQPAIRTELAEYQAAVAAAPERAIEIATIRAYGESLDGFVKQYGDVVKAAINSHRIKSRSSSGIAPGC